MFSPSTPSSPLPRRRARRHRRRAHQRAPGHATLAGRCWSSAPAASFPVTRRLPACATRAGGPLDEVLATFFAAPHSYTAEDVVEISAARQSRADAGRRCGRRVAAGARLAEPGEFTLRALPERAARPRAGGGRGRPGRRGDAAAGAGGVRSARGHADPCDWRARRGSCSTWRVGSRRRSTFPKRGITSSTPDEVRGRAGSEWRAGLDALLSGARVGRLVREGRQIAILGKPERRQVDGCSTGSSGPTGRSSRRSPGTTRDLVTRDDRLRGDPAGPGGHGGHSCWRR